MIEVEIINATLLPSKGSSGIDTFCVLKVFGKECGRTSPVINTFEPIWNEKFERQYDELALLERAHARPFFFEFFDIEVNEISQNKISKIYETRIPFINTNSFKGYKLLKANSTEQTPYEYGRIFVRITRLFGADHIYKSVSTFGHAQLTDLCPPTSPYYRHLYLDFEWSPLMFTYRTGLPGPISGEFVIDKYDNVEWKTPVVQNSFGDRLAGSVRGSLLVTDLRVVFLPVAIHLPFQSVNLVLTDHMSSIHADLLMYYHKFTLQFLLPAIQEVKVSAMATTTDLVLRSLLHFQLVNEQEYDFLVYKPVSVVRDSLAAKAVLPSPLDPANALHYKGLATSGVDPHTWATRVGEYVSYEVRADNAWLRWAKAMRRTATGLFSHNAADRAWIKRAKAPFNLDIEYKRMYVQDLNWRLSDLNASYHLCPTYPSVLVFPGHLEDDDLIAAAPQRSIGRLPALVWLHPETKAPLCRASQPMAGLSGNNIEFDKKVCLAVRASCPNSGLVLRIADARPRLNANANAVQGKGFENITFLGGPSVASLVFLDIDNIHVMRHSLAKLKESFGANNTSAAETTSSLTMTGGSSNATGPQDTTSNTMHSSRWTHHVAGLLRGSCAVADSLQIGHSVLVHCSDGWDRTAQLSTLAQLMLDPHYRTVDGLLALLQKEWGAFGHKFEERLNRVAHLHKEASPVFLQVLDAIYQLLVQFPNDFEYTEDLLLVIVFAMQSGVLATFRGNNERERILFLRAGMMFEDCAGDDLDCSSLAFYVALLLRTSNWSRLLINAQYRPPRPDERKVKYLRPRCANHDVIFWESGLFGLNHNLPDLSSLSGPKITPSESQAASNDLFARLMSFLEVHGGGGAGNGSGAEEPGGPMGAAALLEVLRASPYPSSPFAQSCFDASRLLDQRKYKSLTAALYKSASSAYLYPRRLIFSGENDLAQMFLRQRLLAVLPEEEDRFLFNSLRPSGSGSGRGRESRSHRRVALMAAQGAPPPPPLGDSDDEEDDEEDDEPDSADEGRQDASFNPVSGLEAERYMASLEAQRRSLRMHAAVTVQIWFRALLAARLAVLVHGVAELTYFKARPYGSHLPRKARRRVQAFWRVFVVLASSFLKGRRSLRDYLFHSRAQFVGSILDEVIAAAVDVAQRERLAFQLAENMLQTMGMGLSDGLPALGAPGAVAGVQAGETSPKPSAASKTLSSRLLKPFIGGGGGGGGGGGPDGRSVSPIPRSRSVPEAGGPAPSAADGGGEESPVTKASSKSFTRRMMSGFMSK